MRSIVSALVRKGRDRRGSRTHPEFLLLLLERGEVLLGLLDRLLVVGEVAHDEFALARLLREVILDASEDGHREQHKLVVGSEFAVVVRR